MIHIREYTDYIYREPHGLISGLVLVFADGSKWFHPYSGAKPFSVGECNMTRPISWIANDISKHWPKPYFGAVPYLGAMFSLTDIKENYGADSAKSVVLYFLSNAATWRGPEARRIKAELKEMVK